MKMVFSKYKKAIPPLQEKTNSIILTDQPKLNREPFQYGIFHRVLPFSTNCNACGK
jgi:hypothetical protein